MKSESELRFLLRGDTFSGSGCAKSLFTWADGEVGEERATDWTRECELLAGAKYEDLVGDCCFVGSGREMDAPELSDGDVGFTM